MKRRLLSIAVLVMSAVLLLSSCAKGESATEDFYYGDVYDSAGNSWESPSEESENDSAILDKTVQGESGDRKIIMKYSFSLETKDLDGAVRDLEAAVLRLGGYYESANVSGNTADGGWAELVLRLPSNSVSQFNSEVVQFGNVTHQSKSGTDVTTAYYDTENQLNSLKIQQERLMALLEKAETLDDILKLETELTRVRTEIEGLTTVLTRYDNLIDYTTVTVDLRQVKVYTEAEAETFGAQIAEAFGDSFEFAKEVFQGLVIVLIWLLPYIGFMAVLAVIIIIAVKSAKKKKAVKAEKAEESNEATKIKNIENTENTEE